MFKRIPGTKDILPEEAGGWQAIEKTARETFSLYNYKEIRTPLIEEAALFNRTLGNSTEIVQKQMFLIHNQEDLYALRPEGTASIVRSYIENNLDKEEGFVKLYYIGPMFRMERPQKGRLRQFHHIGCEAIGSQDAALDTEIIGMAKRLLDNLSIGGYSIKINSLGCSRDKEKLSLSLKESLEKEKDNLCQDCRLRLENNVLRILDCKNENCRKIVDKIDTGHSTLCPECREHFDKVTSGLDSLGVHFTVEPRLVRGLDYYNRTVFEITHASLGSQDAIGAGGRYNNLVSQLGGPDAGGIGFAFGVERLILASPGKKAEETKAAPVYLVALGDKAKAAGIKILDRLRSSGIKCDTDYLGKSLKASMRRANDAGARYVLILGDNELENGNISVKDMAQGTQKETKIENLNEELK
ncbi:MAG: histidine--tRNA ligase [Candidatus Omnitrophica bacterium]|nr:histidine--tRNA ligase [Candidatus Omnitrophota bacterium]MDD5500648.1 histidine--tRNA ligase [Candidatus Omnitrophota bacterium]